MPSSRLHPKSAQPKLDSFVKIFAYEAKLGSNFLLADGHVKWLLSQYVSPGYNNGTPGADEYLNMVCNNNISPGLVAAATDFKGNSAQSGGPFVATYSVK